MILLNLALSGSLISHHDDLSCVLKQNKEGSGISLVTDYWPTSSLTGDNFSTGPNP